MTEGNNTQTTAVPSTNVSERELLIKTLNIVADQSRRSEAMLTSYLKQSQRPNIAVRGTKGIFKGMIAGVKTAINEINS